MAAAPRDPRLLQATLDAVAQYGGLKPASRALGIPYPTMQHRLDAANIWQAGRGAAAGTGETETLSVKGDDAELTRTTHERVKSLADLIRVCAIDEAEWHIEKWTCNKWEMGYKDQTATAKALPLFQIKAWLVRKRHVVAAKYEIASLLADANRQIPKRKGVTRRISKPTNILFEPCIPDLHVGKLAWGDETGWAHYDAKAAEQRFEDAVDALIARSQSFGCDHVLFPLGNDLLHADTKAGTTTGGTPLDTDSRYHKSFSLARKLTTRAIDRFRAEIGPVKVLLVPGNHDTLAVWHLGDSLSCYYRHDADVEIDNAPTMRKYHQHGKVMLMFTHGNKGKLAEYPLLMATEQPDMWGATIHREAHTGDKHQLRVQEHRGVKVRISPALCPPDAWHSEMQFVGNAESAEAFIWHPEEGLIGTAFYTVRPERAA
ncbi:MAG TPA: hypothetical protein VNJ04_12135 [Gemmatimonadaceae bacterium]|nr:hypothetical protein [Gemmatimonadaceae bacterium]